ncbi:hypothetical protein [Burkholderia glumae]|uniref:hypothetical protein n=1 Tax=Burkholderia glumae TaxID=337 RepID=UPI00214FAA35|nr:hypothetical protein [Burkholderia glumae]
MTALRIAELERFDEIAKVLRAAVNRQMTAEQKRQRQDLVNAIEKSDLDKVRAITEGKDRCDPVLQGTTAEGFTATLAAKHGAELGLSKTVTWKCNKPALQRMVSNIGARF